MKLIIEHPNVVKFVGIVGEPFRIITEFMHGGDLLTFLEKEEEISVNIRVQFVRGIASGMNHLASQGIVHRY